MRHVWVGLVTSLFVFGVANATDRKVVLMTSKNTFVYSTDGTLAEVTEGRTSYPVRSTDLAGAAPLRAAADREKLIAAYLNGFLECGNPTQTSTFSRQWGQQQAESPAHLERLFGYQILALKDDLVIVSGMDGKKAVVLNRKSGQRISGSPCGASSALVRISPGRRRVAIVSEDIARIDYSITRGKVSWNGKYSGTWSVHVYDLASPARAIASITGAEEPLDVDLADTGDWRVLMAKHGRAWWNPATWLLSAVGHAERISDLALATYTDSGALVNMQEVASGIALGYAWFAVTPAPGKPAAP